MAGTADHGIREAWEMLKALRTGDVCRTAAVRFDPVMKRCIVTSFGRDIAVSPGDRTVSGHEQAPGGTSGEYAELYPLAVLWYLVLAKDIAPGGRLVHLEDLPGGDIFARGTHVLPLDQVALRYGNDREGFLKSGRAFGGEPAVHADAAIRLSPLPRVPVTMTLWLADEEFPARASLFFDSTCGLQLPTDILWSLARLCCLALR